MIKKEAINPGNDDDRIDQSFYTDRIEPQLAIGSLYDFTLSIARPPWVNKVAH